MMARLLLTRDHEGNRQWSAVLRRHGHQPVCLPCVERPIIDRPAVRQRLASAAASTHWWLLTSARGAECLAALLPGHDFGNGAHIAAVGPRTADACRQLLGRCDFMPNEANARALAHQLLPSLSPDTPVTLAVADRARSELQQILSRNGIPVCRIDVYRTLPARAGTTMKTGAAKPGATQPGIIKPRAMKPADLQVDGVLVASPSAAEGLVSLTAGAEQWQVPVIAIGATTAEALKRLGFAPIVSTTPALTSMLEAWSHAHKSQHPIADS